MNDPNKVINVNLSSLLSLKAELLRKQAEVSKAKVAQSTSSSNGQEYVAHTTQKVAEDADDTMQRKKKEKKNRSKEMHKEKEPATCELEDSAMLEKSQLVLKAKAKFYERMQKTGGKLNSDDNCLVMFNKKKQEDVEDERNGPEKQYSSSDDSSEVDETSDHFEDPDDEWVEYTDCLGRTRTCLKRDLVDAKKKDEKLAASMPERLDQTKANWMIDTKGNHDVESNDENDDIIGPLPTQSNFGDGLSIMSKHEEQKANWERKEQENLDKTDVHYQDVFFDEARQHGVGYYAFSTDEEERKKQQIELERVRQETIDEQSKREALKAQREKIIAERVLAAKNRQRARLGLPPLEKEETIEKKDDDDKPKETKEERKARKKAEKQETKRLKEEEEREKERLNHIRPWDKEKDGIAKKYAEKSNDEEWEYKPEREPMSQEQWNEYKRNERLNEFAPPPPPPEKPLKRTNFNSNDSYQNLNNYNNVPPPEMDKGFSKFQSTKKAPTFKRRNYTEATHSTNEDLPSSSNSYKTGVCIPPPSNLEDFFLPSQNKKAKSSHELEKSIEAGLRFLRNNSDKEMPATKSSWTAKADY